VVYITARRRNQFLIKTSGLCPEPRPLFGKSGAKTLIKIVRSHDFEFFVELFLKSSWGLGGKAPKKNFKKNLFGS